MTLRILIVDDEPLAREGIYLCLARENDLELAGQCANEGEAIESIKALYPDFFLDVDRLKLSGVYVLKRV